jgi:hypothetical protein
MSKIPKASALYVFRPETNYTCGICVFMKDRSKGNGCAFFGPSESVDANSGSCGYFTHADPKKHPDVPWLGLFTKGELGYYENPQGFSCKRCEYFGVGKNDCERVDRYSDGDTPGVIAQNACCSLWEPDSRRATMSDEQLIQVISSKPIIPSPDGRQNIARRLAARINT